jgi:uroporphyrin-III C-methyltransferase
VSAKVYLVGAGPGDPELLTIRAARILGSADVVLHDALVSAEVLALIPATAQRIDVGKRCGQRLLSQDDINLLLISYAASHRVIVRLKGGDPLLFGRAGEEMAALRDAGVEFEVVPGISAAFAAAAAAHMSLTDRRITPQVLFTTMHRGAGSDSIPLRYIDHSTTVVIYMPGSDYEHVSRALRENGWPADTPCAIVSHAARPQQVIRTTSLENLSRQAALPAPSLMIVGRTVTPAAVTTGLASRLAIEPRTAAERNLAVRERGASPERHWQ